MGAGHDHSNADTRVSRMLIAAAILTAFFALELTTALMIGSRCSPTPGTCSPTWSRCSWA
jgi:Co/Zn/Cd efflux system component